MYVEMVMLYRSVDDKVVEEDVEVYSFDGLYGGLIFGVIFLLMGLGNLFEMSCDVLGVTSCDGGLFVGVNLVGYIGYVIWFMGIELYFNVLVDFI